MPILLYNKKKSQKLIFRISKETKNYKLNKAHKKSHTSHYKIQKKKGIFVIMEHNKKWNHSVRKKNMTK